MRDLGDWKGYFTATILSRGEEYYQRGEVCRPGYKDVNCKTFVS